LCEVRTSGAVGLVRAGRAERNAPIEPTKRMQYRIGINQGEVVVDDVRVYGDGVNVARCRCAEKTGK
jgi:class 3 adenylate cyclase